MSNSMGVRPNRLPVMLLACVLGEGIAAQQESSSIQSECVTCITLDAGAIRQIGTDSRGEYFIHRHGGVLEKRTSTGKLSWSLSFSEPQLPVPPSEIYSFAVEPSGSILVLGLVKGERTTIVYRVMQDPLAVELLSSFPDWAPGSIAVSPEGRIFAVAFTASKLNRLNHKIQTEPGSRLLFQDTVFHELDSKGEFLRSLPPIRKPLSSLSEVSQLLQEYLLARIIFSPSSVAYLRYFDKPYLRQLDLESGQVKGSIALGTGEMFKEVYIPNIQFIGKSEIVYTLHVRREDFVYTPEVWAMDLSTGSSLRVQKMQDDIGACTAIYDRSKKSLSVVNLAGRLRGQKTATIGARDLSMALRQIRAAKN